MSYQIITTLDPALTQLNDNSSASWYHEQVIGSDNLLICLGDSWTWGDSLGNTQLYLDIDDKEHRVTHIYGHHLANSLNTDFLNIARPGCSNFEIYKKLISILPEVVSRYQQIYLVVTLTENCREFHSVIHSVNSWPIQVDCSEEPSSLNKLLEDYEGRMLEHFKNAVSPYSNVKMLVGRNFTFSYAKNISILDGMQPEKIWVEILSENQNLPGYPKNLRVLSQMSYKPLEKYLKNVSLFQKFKMEIMEIFSDMSDAIDWLDKSAFNYKIATRHPTEMGHELWAKYLLTYFKSGENKFPIKF
jgi:hypothetical protein